VVLEGRRKKKGKTKRSESRIRSRRAKNADNKLANEQPKTKKKAHEGGKGREMGIIKIHSPSEGGEKSGLQAQEGIEDHQSLNPGKCI